MESPLQCTTIFGRPRLPEGTWGIFFFFFFVSMQIDLGEGAVFGPVAVDRKIAKNE